MDNEEKRRLFIRTGILLILICALAYTIYNAVFADKESISEGSEAPNFVLEDTNGERIELSDLKGKGVFLNFWGTWCEPCKKNFLIWRTNTNILKTKALKLSR